MNEERLMEIETRIAFQEHTIKELSDVIYKQQQQIDRLSAICAALEKRSREFAESSLKISLPANEKPPHY